MGGRLGWGGMISGCILDSKIKGFNDVAGSLRSLGCEYFRDTVYILLCMLGEDGVFFPYTD